MSLILIEKIPVSQRQAFEAGVIGICRDLGIANPDWLMIVFNAESRVNPQAKNPNSTATGLIQFIESTARGLGTTTAQLYQMTAVQQLTYVRKYLAGRIKSYGKPSDAYQLYFLVHFPVAFEKENSYVLYSVGSEAYTANALDYDRSGNVTVDEVKKFLDKSLPVGTPKTIMTSRGDVSQTGWIWMGLIGLVIIGGYFIVRHSGIMKLFKK